MQTDATTPNIVAPTMLGGILCPFAPRQTFRNNSKHQATTCHKMQQGAVQIDATCNIQQCWELLANNVASTVCTGRPFELLCFVLPLKNCFVLLSFFFLHSLENRFYSNIRKNNRQAKMVYSGQFNDWKILQLSYRFQSLKSFSFSFIYYFKILTFLNLVQNKFFFSQ